MGNANLLRARFLLLTCGDVEIAYDLREKPSLDTLDKYRISSIPIFYGKVPQYKYKKDDPSFDLTKADQNMLMNRFQKCHDAIWEGGKRDPAEAFDKMSTLMFAKFYDERFTRTGDMLTSKDISQALNVTDTYIRKLAHDSGSWMKKVKKE